MLLSITLFLYHHVITIVQKTSPLTNQSVGLLAIVQIIVQCDLLSLGSYQSSQFKIKSLAHDAISHSLITFDAITQFHNWIHFSVHNHRLCAARVSNCDSYFIFFIDAKIRLFL